jgi:eukaryotic-like serine/threonine-protein kinase
MGSTDRLVLPDEVRVFPVADLPPPVRAAIRCEPDDYAVTRERSRRTTRVVGQAAADLLEEFRRPTRPADAIFRFVQRAGLDTRDVVEGCVPMLNEFISEGFLLPEGMEREAIDDHQLRVGETISGWEVLEPLQIVEDTEVYRVRSPEGSEAVLKRVSSDAQPWVRAALRNELRVLRRLRGDIAPAPIADGTDEDEPYLVISWCEGTPVTSVASLMRRPWSVEARREVAALCLAVLDAYVDLHSQGVLHGDVHPRNLLYTASENCVHVVDFGLGQIPSEAEQSFPGGGVSAFFTPEYAAAALSDKRAPAPPATARSEQYALAALLYELLTGEHYLQQVLEGERWLEAVCQDPPREFRRLAQPSSPAIESVLATALSKKPSHRYVSMVDFREAFVEAVDADLGDQRPASAPAFVWKPPGLFDALAARLGVDGELDRLLSRPTATVNYGAAGIAYLFYRASSLLDRPDLLALADVWIERAKQALDSRPSEACFDPHLGLDPATVGRAALYHSAVGVHCIDGLIACAFDDPDRANLAVARYVAAAQSTETRNDLTTGRAGQLIGTATLMEAIRAAGYPENRLLELGTEMQTGLVSDWSSCEKAVAGSEDALFGVAHGWAGVAFAMLRFQPLSLEPLPPAANEILDELERLAHRDGDRAWWCRGPADDVVWPGWCHGSSGHSMLWAQAHRVVPDGRFLELGRMAAEHAWSESAPMGHLCCGTAGQAYAFLCLHRLTGEDAYVDRARLMLDRSIDFIGDQGMTRNSLYKGDVGVALLETELREPLMSAMPMFESEGWPAA